MKTLSLVSCVLLGSTFAAACASSQTPPSNPETTSQAPAVESNSGAQSDAEVQQPSAEELEQDAAQERLAEDRRKMQGHAQVELRRWTPELRAEAKALADAQYGSLEEGVRSALESEHRVPENAARDEVRKPFETLEFFGMTPNMTVLEYGPGAGWYTEILAPVLAAQGKLWVTSTDPEGSKDLRATYYAERLDLFLKKSPEVYGKVNRAIHPPEQAELDLEGEVDLALVIRGMHGMVLRDQLGAWLDEIHAALNADGTLGVVQHRARPDADPEESAQRGYLPEAWVIEQVEAHGFELEEKSEMHANPKDTKDYPEGVWTLPPTLRLGEKDREKYTEIGESDRMTLRFKKSAKEAASE